MAGANGGAVSQPYHKLQPVYIEEFILGMAREAMLLGRTIRDTLLLQWLATRMSKSMRLTRPARLVGVRMSSPLTNEARPVGLAEVHDPDATQSDRICRRPYLEPTRGSAPQRRRG